MCSDENLIFNADNCRFHRFWVTYSHSIIFLLTLPVLVYGVIYEDKPLNNSLFLVPVLFLIFAICQWLWAWMWPLSFEISNERLIMRSPFKITRNWTLSSIKKIIISKDGTGCSIYQGMNFVSINANITNYNSLLTHLKQSIVKNKGRVES